MHISPHGESGPESASAASATPTPAAKFVTIVSGLPRSGTSMMMRILEAGGMPVLTDDVREADPDNPRGYYEFEPVKELKQDASWVEGARGRAVKVIYKLVYDLPRGIPYRILFLQRDLAEVVASQEKMLERRGQPSGQVPAEMVVQMFQSEVLAFRNWVAAQRDIEVLYVDYAGLIARPQDGMQAVADFLGGDLDLGAMVRVAEPALYRNRR
jgi:hypothetical protein